MSIFALLNHQNVTIMKKSLLTTLVYLFSIVLAVSAPVDEQKARKLASDFLCSKMPATRSVSANLTRAVTGVVDGPDAGLYVFNTDNSFVVISADDDLPSVLAYGLSEPYDAEKAPDAMKALLEAYNYEVKRAVKTRTVVPTHDDIAPLITTKWNQKSPYNLLCPATKSGNCPTGCVATAMAQIMYYHRWPETFDWDKMQTTYQSSDTLESGKAVAELMASCGEKVFMEYGENESSASDFYVCEALRYDFGYSGFTDRVVRDHYTAKSWDELIYSELAANRPVFYAGQSVSSGKGIGGHAFVIDGYQAKDEVGYFHVNWGWGGNSDEYFLISVLNPYYQYTGGNAGSSGYSFSQSAVIGIQKSETEPNSNTSRFYVDSLYIENDKGTYTRVSTSSDFPKIKANFTIFNLSLPEKARAYDLALALYRDHELVSILDEGSLLDIMGDSMKYESGERLYSELAVGKNLADGLYQIRLLSRENGNTNWEWANNTINKYIELDINGTTMTTKTHGLYDRPAISSFVINSVSISDSCKVGEPIKITINVTDNNKTGNSPLFLYGNASLEQGKDKFQLLTGGGTNLDPGETGTVVLEYTPQRAGKFVFYLSGNVNELTDSLYRFEASVSGLALEMDLKVDGAEMVSSGWNELTGTAISGVLQLTNMGVEAYDNYIFIRILRVKGTNYNDAMSVSANIPIGETVDIPFSFEGLLPENYYLILVTAMDGENTKPLNYTQSGTNIKYSYKYLYYLLSDTGINGIQNDAPDAEVYDIRGVRLGKASELKSLPKGVYIINKKKVINK